MQLIVCWFVFVIAACMACDAMLLSAWMRFLVLCLVSLPFGWHMVDAIHGD